jgi:hypothetical protein
MRMLLTYAVHWHQELMRALSSEHTYQKLMGAHKNFK